MSASELAHTYKGPIIDPTSQTELSHCLEDEYFSNHWVHMFSSDFKNQVKYMHALRQAQVLLYLICFHTVCQGILGNLSSVPQWDQQWQTDFLISTAWSVFPCNLQQQQNVGCLLEYTFSQCWMMERPSKPSHRIRVHIVDPNPLQQRLHGRCLGPSLNTVMWEDSILDK